jgi:hypothetical protein
VETKERVRVWEAIQYIPVQIALAIYMADYIHSSKAISICSFNKTDLSHLIFLIPISSYPLPHNAIIRAM